MWCIEIVIVLYRFYKLNITSEWCIFCVDVVGPVVAIKVGASSVVRKYRLSPITIELNKKAIRIGK
jgi:hypothetical protein